MYRPNLLAAVSALILVSAALPYEGIDNRAASCTTDTLAPSTWTSLDLDSYLSKWAAANVTTTSTNNIQSLASSFGAPNFFCGLNDFCNAGQPCEPVDLPGWYILLAIQNWNSYMNSINTGITFASSIAGLILPSIVTDFYPEPSDTVTPLKNLVKIFTSVLSVIPFTGALKTAASVVSGTASLINNEITAPTEQNYFIEWSDISASLAQVLEDYQSAVSTFISDTINAQVNSSAGIDALLKDGQFLGTNENFTEAALESEVADAIKVFAAGLTLQAQDTFIWVLNVSQSAFDEITGESGALCDPTGSATMCGNATSGIDGASYQMIQVDSDGNANDQNDAVSLLMSKYGLTQDEVLIGPVTCYLENGNTQLASPFNGSLSLDPSAPCLFNVKVCIWDDSTYISANTSGDDDSISDVCSGLGQGF